MDKRSNFTIAAVLFLAALVRPFIWILDWFARYELASRFVAYLRGAQVTELINEIPLWSPLVLLPLGFWFLYRALHKPPIEMANESSPPPDQPIGPTLVSNAGKIGKMTASEISGFPTILKNEKDGEVGETNLNNIQSSPKNEKDK